MVLGLLIQVHLTDHTIREASQLQSISSSSQSFITTANGRTSHISGVGSVLVSNDLTLNSFLVVKVANEAGLGRVTPIPFPSWHVL